MKRPIAYAVLLGATAALLACNGWPRPIELKKAEYRPEKYPTYAVTPAAQNQIFSFDSRRFMVTPATVDLHSAKLQQVGTVGSVSIFAPQGEHSPYSALFAPAGGTRYHRVVPLD